MISSNSALRARSAWLSPSRRDKTLRNSRFSRKMSRVDSNRSNIPRSSSSVTGFEVSGRGGGLGCFSRGGFFPHRSSPISLTVHVAFAAAHLVLELSHLKLVAPQEDEFVPIGSSSGEGISNQCFAFFGPGDHTGTRLSVGPVSSYFIQNEIGTIFFNVRGDDSFTRVFPKNGGPAPKWVHQSFSCEHCLRMRCRTSMIGIG